MQQRKRNLGGIKRLLCKAEHYGGILANGIQHDRAGKFRHGLAEDMDALRLQRLQMIQPSWGMLYRSLAGGCNR